MGINLSGLKKVLLISVILSGLLIISTLWTAEPEIVIIYLKDSTTIEGELISYNEKSYRIKVGNDIKEIPWENIDKVEFKSDKLKESPSTSDKSADKPVSPTTSTKYTTFPVIFDDMATRFMTYPYKEMIVVWIIDDSGSLDDDREAIKNNVSNLLDAPILRDKKFLNMAVVGFGDKPKLHCGISRDDNKIKKAIMDVGVEGSGIENCMAAIDYCIKMFKQSALKKIFIMVTDEGGDDNDRLEEILKELKKYNITVYVIGGEASFAQPFSDESHRKIEWGQTTINSGIESVVPEILSTAYSPIPLYISSSRKGRIKSGFPPYAQARLCIQTNGYYYFLKDASYDRKAIKSYEPDLCSHEEYDALNKKDRLRSVVSDIRQKLDDFSNNHWFSDIKIRIDTTAEAKESLQLAREALVKVNAYIKEVESALSSTSSSKTSKRWIANAEMLIAQLYRLCYFLNQYILTLDEWMKGKDFFNPPLAPDTGTRYAEYYCVMSNKPPIRQGNADGSKIDYKAFSEKALDKVMAEHPNTPWSAVAQGYREDDRDFGHLTYRIERQGGNERKSPVINPPPKKH